MRDTIVQVAQIEPSVLLERHQEKEHLHVVTVMMDIVQRMVSVTPVVLGTMLRTGLPSAQRALLGNFRVRRRVLAAAARLEHILLVRRPLAHLVVRTIILLLTHLAAQSVLLAHLHHQAQHRAALARLDRIVQAMVRRILALPVKAPPQGPQRRQDASSAQQGKLLLQEVSVRPVLLVKSLLQRGYAVLVLLGKYLVLAAYV
jgi:hypothetical protein